MPSHHATQLNDYTSSASMDAFLSHPFRWIAPMPFDVHPRSENQLFEGTLAGLIQNPSSIIAYKALIDLLDRYDKTGHQGKEFATPSHAPHWYRPAAVGLWWAIEHQKTHPDILDALIHWWCYDQWIRDQYRVPRGALANQIIGWGARDGGFKGHNEIRDIVDALLSSHPLNRKQKHTLSNASKNADTFSLFVLQSLVTKHSDVITMIKPIKPSIDYALEFSYTDEALTCTCHNPQSTDPHVINVDYSIGKVSITL